MGGRPEEAKPCGRWFSRGGHQLVGVVLLEGLVVGVPWSRPRRDWLARLEAVSSNSSCPAEQVPRRPSLNLLAT